MFSWREVVAFSQPLTREDVRESDNDRVITFRPMTALPVIIWDKEVGARRVVPMRWGWPDPKNWKIPKNIHARGETIDTTKLFAPAFLGGQRGIRTFDMGFDLAPLSPGNVVRSSLASWNVVPPNSGTENASPNETTRCVRQLECRT